MAGATAYLIAFLACLVGSSWGDAFLQVQSQSVQVSTKEVERTLMSEMFDASKAGRLNEIMQELSPMFSALPKTEDGTLDSATVRYALHRYFVQKHGWILKGVEPSGSAYNASVATVIMKDKAPAYIQSIFEHRLSGRGMGLHDLAAFAATLVDLVHQEMVSGLEMAFSALDLPLSGSVDRAWTDRASKAYFMTFIFMTGKYPANMAEYQDMEETVARIYPGWDETFMWMQDMRKTVDFSGRGQNPFTGQDSFYETTQYIDELGYKFGSFQNLECHALKQKLLEMEIDGSGRVPLSRFYKDSMEGDSRFFTESTRYLKNLGALDDTDPLRPAVVIPNYLTSHTNCLSSSGFYSICCSDQCEPLLGHIEAAIGHDSASASQIAGIVSSLPSETVNAPRNISSAILARLEDISVIHGGHIPLHGRLFSQWLHHVYPRECPFPHVSGTVNSMTAWDWAKIHGAEGLDATFEEMERHHKLEKDNQAEQGSSPELPWSNVEELVTQQVGGLGPRRSGFSVRGVVAMIALVAFVLPLVKASDRVFCSHDSKARDKVEAHFV